MESAALVERWSGTISVPPRGDDPLSNLTDKSRFEQLQRVATMMGTASFTPKHLVGSNPQQTIANCFRVVNQAMRWGFDPFPVADETYVVHGRLGYQGKLVAAVINARAGLDGRLKAVYSGSGDGRTVTVIGKFCNEDDPREVDLVLKDARTANEMWKKDPDQKLWYSGVIKWARRHCPELILGVLTDDDLERIAESSPGKPEEIPNGRHSTKEPATGSNAAAPATNPPPEPPSAQTAEAPQDKTSDQQQASSTASDNPPADEMAQKFLEDIKGLKTKPAADDLLGKIMKAKDYLGSLYREVYDTWKTAAKSLK